MNSKWALQPQAAPVQSGAAAAAAPTGADENMDQAPKTSELKRKRGTRVGQAYDGVKKREAAPAAGEKSGRPVIQPKALSERQQKAHAAFLAFVENDLERLAGEAWNDSGMGCIVM